MVNTEQQMDKPLYLNTNQHTEYRNRSMTLQPTRVTRPLIDNTKPKDFILQKYFNSLAESAKPAQSTITNGSTKDSVFEAEKANYANVDLDDQHNDCDHLQLISSLGHQTPWQFHQRSPNSQMYNQYHKQNCSHTYQINDSNRYYNVDTFISPRRQEPVGSTITSNNHRNGITGRTLKAEKTNYANVGVDHQHSCDQARLVNTLTHRHQLSWHHHQRSPSNQFSKLSRSHHQNYPCSIYPINDPNSYYNLSNIDTIKPRSHHQSPIHEHMAPAPIKSQITQFNSIDIMQICNAIGQQIDSPPRTPQPRKYTVCLGQDGNHYKINMPQIRFLHNDYSCPKTGTFWKKSTPVTVLEPSKEDRSKFTIGICDNSSIGANTNCKFTPFLDIHQYLLTDPSF